MRRISLCIMLVLIIISSSISVFAQELEVEEILKPTGVMSKDKNIAEGLNNSEITAARESLIEYTNLRLYLSSGRKLVIEARTRCIEQVDKVGFTDISLQRWSGSKWVNVVTPWDDLISNVRNHDLSYSRTVDGGYYYKVSLYHYAQQGSGLFANKQEIFNETSYLWVD